MPLVTYYQERSMPNPPNGQNRQMSIVAILTYTSTRPFRLQKNRNHFKNSSGHNSQRDSLKGRITVSSSVYLDVSLAEETKIETP